MTITRLELAKDTAERTGKLLQRYFQAGNQPGTLKADQTLVTEADRAADQFIQDRIFQEYPSDQILSEEGSTFFPDGRHVWVIDPLDGTVNFSKGMNHWGISIAHLKNGLPQTAVVFFPETSELFSAEKGGGAELNGRRLMLTDDKDNDLFQIFVHCSRMSQRYRVNLPYKTRSLGSAAYHLCLVSNNTATLAFESTPKIWDIAGAWLIVSEAGGVITSLGNNQPFPAKSGVDYQNVSFPTLAAESDDILADAREKIIRK